MGKKGRSVVVTLRVIFSLIYKDKVLIVGYCPLGEINPLFVGKFLCALFSLLLSHSGRKPLPCSTFSVGMVTGKSTRMRISGDFFSSADSESIGL